MEPKILLCRDRSGMVSTWEECLCIEPIDGGKWHIGTYGYDLVANFYDVIPEEDRYDADGEEKVPEIWEGKKIRGLADGEWLQSWDLVDMGDGGVDFDGSSLTLAQEYCQKFQWAEEAEFKTAWSMMIDLIESGSFTNS